MNLRQIASTIATEIPFRTRWLISIFSFLFKTLILCIRKVVDEAIEKFSGLDHLILNHGMMPVKPVREMSPDLVERVLLGNHVSHALIAKHSLEHLIKSKGQISVMSSTSGTQLHPRSKFLLYWSNDYSYSALSSLWLLALLLVKGWFTR